MNPPNSLTRLRSLARLGAVLAGVGFASPSPANEPPTVAPVVQTPLLRPPTPTPIAMVISTSGTVIPSFPLLFESLVDLIQWSPFWWIPPDSYGDFSTSRTLPREGLGDVRFFRARPAATADEP